MFWGWRTKIALSDRYLKYINFNDMFIMDVFNLQDDYIIDTPKFNTEKNMNFMFDEKHLNIHKTVILSPYGGWTSLDVEPDFWEKISHYLIDKGFSVCTNSSGDNQPVIKGTMPIFFSFYDSVPFMNMAGYFIGIRSGLCDVISSSSCEKIIIYEEGVPALRKHFFDLKEMGLNNSANELVLSGGNSKKLYDEIITIIDSWETDS